MSYCINYYLKIGRSCHFFFDLISCFSNNPRSRSKRSNKCKLCEIILRLSKFYGKCDYFCHYQLKKNTLQTQKVDLWIFSQSSFTHFKKGPLNNFFHQKKITCFTIHEKKTANQFISCKVSV